MLVSTQRIAIVVGILISSSGPTVGDEASLRQRLLTEATAAWSELEQSETQIEGTFTMHSEYANAVKPPVNKRCNFTRNGSLLRVISDVDDKAPQRSVRAANSGYSFWIVRPKGSSKFAVAFLTQGMGEGNAQQRAAIQHEVREYLNDVYCAWYITGKSLAEWLKDPEFEISRVEEVERDGKQLVRVRFDYQKREADPKKRLMLGGEIVLDPKAHWTITEYKENTWWGTVNASLLYGEPVDNMPFVREKKEVWTGDGTWTRTLRFESLTKKVVPEADFKLSAFGLPEPDFAGWGNSSRLWFVLTTALFAGAAIALLRRRKPRALLAGESPP